ncbi:hypothetical protein [Methylobacter sp.]|uniref:hypothetical protein n=1 Tax=Methylobacter sp. TaxID=2051955 RepID=UPI0025CBEE0B|nr:hypothetical protein [Methylobacter sp.]
MPVIALGQLGVVSDIQLRRFAKARYQIGTDHGAAAVELRAVDALDGGRRSNKIGGQPRNPIAMLMHPGGMKRRQYRHTPSGLYDLAQPRSQHRSKEVSVP